MDLLPGSTQSNFREQIEKLMKEVLGERQLHASACSVLLGAKRWKLSVCSVHHVLD